MWRIHGATHYNIPHLPNMVARRDLCAAVRFPVNIYSGSVANEDWALKQWIEQQGYRCVNAPVYVKHYSNPNHKETWFGASLRLSKVESFKSLLIRSALAFPQGVYTALISGNARLIGYWVQRRFKNLYGYLHYARYFDLKRGKQTAHAFHCITLQSIYVEKEKLCV
jgi:hypothetical protein